MKKFKHLNKLTPYVDAAFKSFYDAMLNDSRLGVFFENQEQIRMLIKKQKEHFKISLTMSTIALKDIYVRLGEYHYDLKIPYVDFIKGTDILEENFLLNTQRYEASDELMEEIFQYFKLMKAFTAKGYLNRMLEEDKKDIESFFEKTPIESEHHLPRAIVLEKIQWLKDLLYSIENDEIFDLQTSSTMLETCLDKMEFLSEEKKHFFEDLEKRILINTHNLFYFLQREEYLEILPLYTSLLSIYKLTLMMNNAVTIEYANKVIEDMRLDSLTKLFRKDVFEQILKKEMALAKREKKYKLSVAYLDLDNFKTVNDSYGHYSGDKVIEQIGQTIRNTIRKSDIGFRIGGDEFAIIFKNSTKEEAKIACQKIQKEFNAYEFVFNDEISFYVNMSIGISDFFQTSQEDFKQLLENIDKKLYESKNKGKNQISI